MRERNNHLFDDGITRVWGTVDGKPVEFERRGRDWKISLPPNLRDGKFACQFFAQNVSNEVGVWTGFLYMSDGVCHLDLLPDIVRTELLPDMVTVSLEGCG